MRERAVRSSYPACVNSHNQKEDRNVETDKLEGGTVCRGSQAEQTSREWRERKRNRP